MRSTPNKLTGLQTFKLMNFMEENVEQLSTMTRQEILKLCQDHFDFPIVISNVDKCRKDLGIKYKSKRTSSTTSELENKLYVLAEEIDSLSRECGTAVSDRFYRVLTSLRKTQPYRRIELRG